MAGVFMPEPQRAPVCGGTADPSLGTASAPPTVRATITAATGTRSGRSTASASARPARQTRLARRAVDPVLRVQTNLTARDHTIIAWLGDHGVLTTHQVAFALFPSADVAQRRLRLLTELGLIQRFRPLRLDGGSYPFHYVLDHLGALVLAIQREQDAPRPAQSRARMHALTRRSDLNHMLGVNGFFTDLAGYARTHPGAALQRWWPTARCTEWDVFPTGDGRHHGYRLPIRPDAHGVFTDNRTNDPENTRPATVPFFLEHDTGTEPLTTLLRKIPGYEHLARHVGHRWPVLFWLHSSTRERHLQEHLAGGPPPDVPVATAARDRTDGQSPAEAIWWLHGAAGSPWKRLAELPTTPFTGDPPKPRRAGTAVPS
jgi:predicted transcriptional regulator